ncbi:MAG: tape measure protein [Porticoccaceae bacterium]|nr:tape measure protein [Porticoccaceae bacterium]
MAGKNYTTGLIITGDASGAIRATRLTDQALRDLNGSARRTASQTASAWDKVKASLFSVNGAVGAVAGGLSLLAAQASITSLVRIADEMKLIDSRLKVATSTTQDYLESQKELVAISMRTGTSFEANASMFSRVNKSMEAMGGTARDTAALTELIAKSLSISGTSAGEASSVIRQLSQAMASGVLRGDEFNSIMENGSRLAYALAAGIGVNVGELRKMAEDGQLTSGKVIRAIMSQAAVIDAEYKKLPLTVGAAFENVKTQWGQYVLAADAGSGATAGLAEQVNILADNLAPLIDAIVTLGKVAATVFAGQMLISIGQYTAAKYAAITVERAHAAALAMDLERTVALTTARLAATQAEIAATQATLAGNLSMGARMGLTNQLNVLLAAQTAQTAAVTAATAAQTAATVTFASSLKMLLNPINLVNIGLAALVGWEIGTWLRSFQTVRIVATATLGAILQGIENVTYGWNVMKAVMSGNLGALDDLKAAHLAEKAAIDDNIVSSIAYELSSKKAAEAAGKESKAIAGLAGEKSTLSDAQKKAIKDAEATAKGIKAEMDALHEQHLKLTLSARDYYAATLAAKGMSAAQSAMAMSLWDANKALEAQKTRHDKAKSEMDTLIDKHNQLTLSAREYYAVTLQAGGLSPEQSRPLLEQFDKNAAFEKTKRQTDDARAALDDYASSLDKAAGKMADMGAVSSAVFDGALGGVNALSGAFSNMVSALQENTQALSTLREKQSLNELDKENKNYQKNVVTFAKEEARLKQANIDASIDGIMQVAGASSKMFDQNSEEAKAMNLVVLGGLAAKAAAAMLTQGTGDPYTAFARIAAMGTLVAGIMSAAGAGGFDFSGGGSVSAPTVSSSTGTVLGDSEAKSASVNNTYELLQDIHAKEYATLRSIDQGIYNLKSGITDVITRLFQEGGIAVPTIDGKAKYAVDMQALNLTIGGPLGLMAEFAKKLPVIGGLISGIEDFVIGGLFGKTTRSVTGSGIGSNPTSLMDIMNGGDIAGYQYATIETKKKSWFSTKKSYSEQQMALDEATQDALTRVFKGMGQTMYGLAEQLGHDTKQKVEAYVVPAMKVELHGLSGEDAAKKLNDVISASLDTMADAVFGEILGQYQKLGEGLLETTTRIVAEIALVNDALAQSGVTIAGDAIAVSDAIVQASGGLKAFQEAFAQAFDKFADDDAKQRRLVASLQVQLAELFPQSTINTIARSREEYVKLVAGLDQTNPKYAEQYALLIKLAEGADQYYSAIEEAEKKLRDLIQSFIAFSRSLQSVRGSIGSNIVSLGGAASTVGPAWQQSIIDNLYKQLAATSNNADKISVIGEINTAVMNRYSAELEALGKVEESVKRIRDYIDNLKLSDKSPLTNAQKLAEAQAQYSTQLAMARAGDKDALAGITASADAYLAQARGFYASSQNYTDIFDNVTGALSGLSGINGMDEATYKRETLALQDKAIRELQSLDKTLIAIYEREQAAYQTRHDQLMAALPDDSLVKMIEQGMQAASTALGRTLTEFESHWIRDQFNSGRDKTSIYAEAGQYIQQEKLHGSHATGLDYVPFDGYRAELHKGERVLTAAQARRQDGETDQALIAELRALRAEVERLRADQRAHTEAIVVNNRQAASESADKIANSNADATRAANWQSRNKVIIK